MQNSVSDTTATISTGVSKIIEFNKSLELMKIDKIVENYRAIAREIEAITGVIDNLDLDKAVALSDLIYTVEAKPAENTVAENLVNRVDSVATNNAELLAAGKTAAANVSADGQSQILFNPKITLEVDGKELAKIVWKKGVGRLVTKSLDSDYGMSLSVP